MNTIDLDGKRDFPFTTNVLKFMQDATAILEKMAAFGGDNFILSGCDVNGANSRSSGFLVLNGLVMPFLGGTVQATIKIVKTDTQITVAEGTRDETVYHAEFGSTTTPGYQFDWDTIEANKFDGLVDLTDRLVIAEAELDNISYSSENPSITCTTSSASITKIYARANKSQKLTVLNTKFNYAHSGETNPRFQFSFVAANAITDMEFKVWEANYGNWHTAKIVGKTPLLIEIEGTFQTAIFLINIALGE
jgi:hypothetical protein